MTSPGRHEDGQPNAPPLRSTTRARRCGACTRQRQVNADGLCAACDLYAAEAEACRSEMTRYDRVEELSSEGRAFLGRLATLLEDETASRSRNEIRVSSLRGAEIAMREVINQLHRAGGV